MVILILGATGMLGNAAFKLLSSSEHEVYGTIRQQSQRRHFPDDQTHRLIAGVDVENFDTLAKAFAQVHPDVVINCIGVVKQLDSANDPLTAVPINSILPHRLARLCAVAGARLIHVSTDCVFRGDKGLYKEEDTPDASDLYGRSKLLGEVDYPNAITLRTSIIGRELGSRNGLVEWFLSQQGLQVRGFRSAVFSGFTTDELTRLIERVIAVPELRGLYHASSAPIDKFSLLGIVRDVYRCQIEIEPDDGLKIDRSLDSARLRAILGYTPPSWHQMIERMRSLEAV